jgi:hypothetical protein
MRALSLWQPHATLCCLIAKELGERKPSNASNPLRLGEKVFVTRGPWAGRVPLGDLVIHAAKATNDLELIHEPPFAGVLRAHGVRAYELIPLGAALGVVEVVAVWRTTDRDGFKLIRANGRRPTLAEMPLFVRDFGDFSPGRILLQMQNVRPLRQALPMRGRQGLFTLTPQEEADVRALLPTT